MAKITIEIDTNFPPDIKAAFNVIAGLYAKRLNKMVKVEPLPNIEEDKKENGK